MPFFKVQNSTLEEASNIDGPGFSLCELDRDKHTYPVEGWHWFATTAEARVFFNLPEPEPVPMPMPMSISVPVVSPTRVN